MRKARPMLRIATLLPMLAAAPICFASPAAPDGAPLHLQRGTGAMNDLLSLPALRSRGGTVFDRVKLDLRPPDLAATPEAHLSVANNDAADVRTNGRPEFQLTMEKPMSPAKAIAVRAQHEGVPFARLWENKSALVSVGLNQKGHLGLWLIQKTH
jgi:hypothetical protein